MTDITSLFLYSYTNEFLKKRSGEGFAAPKIDRSETKKIKNIKAIYKCLLDALLSTKRMRDTIGPVEAFDKALFGFDPIKTDTHYNDQPDRLIQQIEEILESPQDNKQKEYLETFCKGALSAAHFLTQFKAADAFKRFVREFQDNSMARAVLPLLLQKEINGLMVPTACAFLSNVGFPEYVCPDPKVKTLFMDIGVSESMDNYEVLKRLIEMSWASGKDVSVLHKGFGWIANGKVTEDSDKNPQLRQEYLEYVIKKLFGHSPT